MWITEAADVGLVTCKLKSEPLMALLNDNDNYDWNKLIKKKKNDIWVYKKTIFKHQFKLFQFAS